MTNPSVANGLRRLFQSRASFVLVGLTGRTGSGCSTATSILTKNFDQLSLTKTKTEYASIEDRKHRIAFDYAHKNWTPFLASQYLM